MSQKIVSTPLFHLKMIVLKLNFVEKADFTEVLHSKQSLRSY